MNCCRRQIPSLERTLVTLLDDGCGLRQQDSTWVDGKDDELCVENKKNYSFLGPEMWPCSRHGKLRLTRMQGL